MGGDDGVWSRAMRMAGIGAVLATSNCLVLLWLGEAWVRGEYYTVTGKDGGWLWQIGVLLLWAGLFVVLGLLLKRGTVLLPAVAVVYPYVGIFSLSDKGLISFAIKEYAALAITACIITNATVSVRLRLQRKKNGSR